MSANPVRQQDSCMHSLSQVLSGYQIPAGTHVDLNPSVHFRDPKLFPDPDSHRPERWLRGPSSPSSEAAGEEDAIHPYLLTPFGHGTRMCAGRRYVDKTTV